LHPLLNLGACTLLFLFCSHEESLFEEKYIEQNCQWASVGVC
jgi:hypothetical protein